jgi:hypothetical protein
VPGLHGLAVEGTGLAARTLTTLLPTAVLPPPDPEHSTMFPAGSTATVWANARAIV